MHIRRDPGARSFGKRRVEAGGPNPDRASPRPSTGLLVWTLRVSACVGFAAIAGGAQLARWNTPGGIPVRVAGAAVRLPADPETTGAIANVGAARGTHLDPCFLPVPERLRP